MQKSFQLLTIEHVCKFVDLLMMVYALLNYKQPILRFLVITVAFM